MRQGSVPVFNDKTAVIGVSTIQRFRLRMFTYVKRLAFYVGDKTSQLFVCVFFFFFRVCAECSSNCFFPYFQSVIPVPCLSDCLSLGLFLNLCYCF